MHSHATGCDTLTPGMPPPGTGFIIGNMASAPLLDVSAKATIISLNSRYNTPKTFYIPIKHLQKKLTNRQTNVSMNNYIAKLLTQAANVKSV